MNEMQRKTLQRQHKLDKVSVCKELPVSPTENVDIRADSVKMMG